MAQGIPGYLRYRVIKRFDAGNAEITDDLPHLHQSTWRIGALQPGNPSNAALGSFTIPLHPPGSPGFKANWSNLYSTLARYQRVEGYLGYNSRSIGLGKLKFAGLITGITLTDNPPRYELIGVTDLGLWNMYRPFPGELTGNAVTSTLIKNLMASNELGWSDTFNPFTAGNYVSTNTPAHSAGSWSGTTDDGLNVVSNANTGTGAALLSKSGASFADGWNSMYVEVQCRLSPSADATSAGQAGIGFSSSNANCNTSVVGYIEAFKSSGRYSLNAKIAVYSGGSLINSATFPTSLTAVDDPSGTIPLTLGLLISASGNSGNSNQATLVVNGRPVIPQYLTSYAATSPQYPFLFFGNPATGSATVYMTNLAQFTRYDAATNPSNASVIPGTITTSTNSIGFGVSPGNSLLDGWTRLQNREGWWLRYTPQSYVVGTRTLGKLDMAADPGTDRTGSCIFSRRKGNLLNLTIEDNADAYVAGSEVIGQSTLDGGGVAHWNDISTLVSLGVIRDQTLSFAPADFNTQRAIARRMIANKTSVGSAGSKTAVVLRDGDTADVWRELDKVTIDDPWFGLNMASTRILAREFTEGSPTERITLDQFSWHGGELE